MNSDRGMLYQDKPKATLTGSSKKAPKQKGHRKELSAHLNSVSSNIPDQRRKDGYEENYHAKNQWKKTALKDKMSPLLSQNDQSSSDDENFREAPERLTTLSKSGDFDEGLSDKNNMCFCNSPRQSEYETCSELTDEFKYYFYENQHEPAKKIQQIQYLQNQLAKLMEKDENTSQATSQYTKSTSQKNIDTDQNSRVRSNTNPHYRPQTGIYHA